MNLRQFVPILDWLPGYSLNELKGDISAGLTVGVMLIPQGMAYALLAGLPPQYGLYTAIVPLIIYAIFGTSRQLAVGPVAMVSLMTMEAIGPLAEVGSSQYISLAIILALMVGLIQFVLGVFRLGFLVNFLSHPVISGFTSAAAIIIGLSQLKHLMGISIPRGLKVHEILLKAIESFDQIHWISFAIGIAGILLIFAVKKFLKSIPGSLVAVIFGIVVMTIFHLENTGVKIVGDIPSSLPHFSVPDLNADMLSSMFPVALTLALVGFMESIAVAKAIQAKHKNYKIDSNQELLAQGLSNILGSFFQSYPAAGGFGRTAVNDQAGAKTGIAAFISAGMIILTLLFLTPLFYNLPKAILGSIVMVAVVGLIDIKEAKHLWHSNRRDFVLLMVAFFCTLIFDPIIGIAIGVLLSLAMVIFKTTRPHVAVLGNVPDTHFYRNVERFDNLLTDKGILIVRFDAQLYFANSDFFKDKIESLVAEKGEGLKLVIINAESINNLDSSAVRMLGELVEDLSKTGVEIAFTGVKGPVRDAMVKGCILEIVQDNHFFMSVQEAVDCYKMRCFQDRDIKKKNLEGYTMQTNAKSPNK